MNDAAAPPRQWFSPAFERLGARYAGWLFDQTDVYNDYHPAGEWHVDIHAGTFTQSGVPVRMAPLGSLGTDGSWMWAWANEAMYPPDSQHLAWAMWLRELGQQHGIPELTTPRLELAAFAEPRGAAERLIQAAAGPLAARGYGSVTADTGARFAMVMVDPSIPQAQLDLPGIGSRIIRGIKAFPFDHRGSVTGYLERYGFSVEQTPEGGIVGRHTQGTVTGHFDEQERLSGLDVTTGG